MQSNVEHANNNTVCNVLNVRLHMNCYDIISEVRSYMKLESFEVFCATVNPNVRILSITRSSFFFCAAVGWLLAHNVSPTSVNIIET